MSSQFLVLSVFEFKFGLRLLEKCLIEHPPSSIGHYDWVDTKFKTS